MRVKYLLILQTIFALAAVEFLVLWGAYLASLETTTKFSGPALTAQEFLFAFLISTALLLLLLRTLRQRWIFEGIFALSIFSGVWFLGTLIIPRWALIIAIILVAGRYVFPYVLTQNMAIILGVAGIGAALGFVTPWTTTALVLVILAVYDVVAVYFTRHMVAMFKGMMERGVIFALTIPEHPRLLWKKMKDIAPGEGFFFLGTGDLAVPAVFTASAARADFMLGVGAAIGALVGIFFTNLIFQWEHKRPMPALPPIAFGTLLGFFLTKLVI